MKHTPITNKEQLVDGMVKLYRITWSDACSRGSWTGLEEACDMVPPIVVSIGFLMNETSEYYTLTSTVLLESLYFSELITIPKGMAKRVEYIDLTVTPFIEVKKAVVKYGHKNTPSNDTKTPKTNNNKGKGKI